MAEKIADAESNMQDAEIRAKLKTLEDLLEGGMAWILSRSPLTSKTFPEKEQQNG